MIREREISLREASGKGPTWEEVQKESGGEGEQVVGSGGKGRERRSGAEVGSGESGAKVGSGGEGAGNYAS